MCSGRRRRAAARILVVALVLLVVVAAFSVSYLYFGVGSGQGGCDQSLLAQIGAVGSGLCLRPLKIIVSGANSSEFVVPVLTMKAGSSGTISILYDLAAGTYVSRPYEKPNVTASDIPLALSVATARPSPGSVDFSDARALFNSSHWVVFTYDVRAAQNATGYYAILPPEYAGVYPPIAVGGDANALNMISLAMFGYTGLSMSGEVIVPSTIVGASGMTVVNATIPMITTCPNSACVFVSYSLY